MRPATPFSAASSSFFSPPAAPVTEQGSMLWDIAAGIVIVHQAGFLVEAIRLEARHTLAQGASNFSPIGSPRFYFVAYLQKLRVCRNYLRG